MRARQRGFTLIELMVSLVLFSFAIAGVLAVAVSMSQGFRDQRQAVNAEAAVRIPLDFIVDAIRQASPAAPTGTITDASTGVCAAGVLKVTPNQTAAHDATLTGWDQLEVIYAAGAAVTSTRTSFDGSSVSVDVSDATQLATGDYIVISNTSIGTLVKITGVAGNTLSTATLCGSPGLPTTGSYSPGSLVVRAQHAVFFLDTVDGVPTLMMNPTGNPATNQTAGVSEPLAEGIEDMQIALGVDTNADAVITDVGAAASDDEWQGNFAGDANLVGTIRAVRVTLISRTAGTIQGNATPFVRPAAEDHAAATTNDKYRRRILRSTVEVRNMGASP